jgi:hypothetical protein
MMLSVNKHVLGLEGLGWAETCNDGTSRAHDAFFNYHRYANYTRFYEVSITYSNM